MKNSVELIPILDNNYVFLIKNSLVNSAIIVDPGEAPTVAYRLSKQNLKLSHILITHHHGDHIDGVSELRSEFNAQVYAPEKNKNEILNVEHYLKDGDQIEIDDFEIEFLELPGHTVGIGGYWFRKEKWLFSGDVIFGLGCGRLFEGTAQQMFESLQKIKSLPDETLIFCTHEYTATNLRFCKSLVNHPDLKNLIRLAELTAYEIQLDSVREKNKPSVPLSLISEKICNPFLLAENFQQIALLRQLRNSFR